MRDIDIKPITPEICEEIGGHDYMIALEGDPETAAEVCSLCGHEKDPA
jgi:hypothetical protein